MTFDEKQVRVDELSAGDGLSDRTAYASLDGPDDIVLDGRFTLADLKTLIAIMEAP